VSIQASIAKTAYLALESWEVTGKERPRGSSRYSVPWSDNKLRIVWELKDGWAYKLFSTGEFGARENPLIVNWMAEEGMADEYLLGLKWAELDWRRFSQPEIDRLEAVFQKFFLSKTKAQIEEGAIKRGIVLQVIYAPSDILKHPQLKARQFWKEMPAATGIPPFSYPQRFCLPSRTDCDIRKGATLETDPNPEWLSSFNQTSASGSIDRVKPSIAKTHGAPAGALTGVRVVAFEQALAMPLCTSLLAMHGAEVIRVETSTRLDWHRQAGPFINNDSRPDLSVPYLFVNSGKLGVTINLKKERGIELARRLVTQADVVVENYAPGVLGRLGLGYEDLSKIKPDLIMCAAGIFGQSGPYSRMRGHGGPLTALTGFPSITGHPGQMPQFPGFVLTDFTAPRACLLAIISALDYQARTGVGQYLDVSQFESAVHLLTSVILAYQMENRNPAPIGNRSEGAWPCGVYRCSGPDRWCAIVVNSQAEWEKLCVTMDMAELAADIRFKSIELRQINHEELDRLITAWTEKRSAQEIMHKLQAGGIEAMAVQTGQEMGSDPQLKHRGFYRSLEQLDGLRYTYSGSPALMSANPASIKRAPQLGEHNAQVFTGLLGIDEEEFVKLLNEGVLD
jgi:benzylsuccinate CoA-transferase BbsF subunit